MDEDAHRYAVPKIKPSQLDARRNGRDRANGMQRLFSLLAHSNK
jgi:hypothetical protein